jgi:hypothetical protein
MIMDPFKYTFEDQVNAIEDYLDKYLKKKPPDCVLYSEDNTEFKIHKELFGQTDFMRKILSSAKERCCGLLEILCPCSKEELSLMVKFLYTGEICCETKFDSLNIVEILNKIFGFTKNLMFMFMLTLFSAIFSHYALLYRKYRLMSLQTTMRRIIYVRLTFFFPAEFASKNFATVHTF